MSGSDKTMSLILNDQLKITPAAALTAAGVFQATAGGNLVMGAPGTNRLLGKGFTVQASGYASTKAGTYTATIQPVLYGDASLATVTTKPLFSATAGTLAYTGTVGAAIPFTLWAELEGDSLSGTFGGFGQSSVGTTVKAQAATVAPVSAINFATEPPISFAVGVNVAGTLGATPQIVLTEFFIWQA